MATAVDYGNQEQAMQAYFREGRERAMALGNRGPLRFTAEGKLDPAIREAYERLGFYVFEGVIAPAELAELEADYLDIFERLPVAPGARLDRHGRPALGHDLDMAVVHWSKPLSDPSGGTDQAQGRHPVKMFEPVPAAGVPEKIVSSILGPLYLSEAMLRLCGHPGLLRVAAEIDGEDFTPFQEGIIVKRPGEGQSFAWHQDGTTHWDSPDWTMHSHGFNFMPQLYGSTPANGVWFVPGTHAKRRADIRAMVAEAGSERLPDAVPLVCAPGDVCIASRQALHGSFANTSPDIRVTLSFGLLPRRSVIGAHGHNHNASQAVVFDDEWVRKRSEAIGYALAARRQHFPDETPFTYRPHAEAGTVFEWNEAGREALRDYNRLDIRI